MSIIRLEEIPLDLNENETHLTAKAAKILSVSESEILDLVIVKKSVDSRNRRRVFFACSVDVSLVDASHTLATLHPHIILRYKVKLPQMFVYTVTKTRKPKLRPVVVGSGPCGLFAALIMAEAGLEPLVIERGKPVAERIKDVEQLAQAGELNLESNIQFGEGGAGTFSDGKLYTTINDKRTKFIFTKMIEAGAPKEISWSATPHIGTDKLRPMVSNIRKKITSLGGEFSFGQRLTGINIDDGRVVSVVINNSQVITCDTLVLAIGHSARDTYAMLEAAGVPMKQKPLSIGLRIEHLAADINKAMYHNFSRHPKLPTAKYKLVQHLPGERSVYTFCMCPGGFVVPAASEANSLAVNGMSFFARDGQNSNSAILVPVLPEDFPGNGPLAGLEFQRQFEKAAYNIGGGGFRAPIQLVGDFLQNRVSQHLGRIEPSYRPGYTFADLAECLPDFAIRSLKLALPAMGQKIKGFDDGDAVLTGVETRSSSPVRICRDEFGEADIKGIFPAGEGAGYAGGIISSALDGLKAGEEIIRRCDIGNN